jgi:hypothetical protein
LENRRIKYKRRGDKMKKILSQNFAPAELTDTESETVGLNQEPKTEEIEETDVSQLLQLLKTKNNT